MEIFITTASIIFITGFIWLLNKLLPLKICPICVGISGTWLLILFGIYLGWLEADSWKLIAAIAMGGTVTGIAYQGEKRFDWAAKSIFYFRVPVILIGFIFVWWAVNNLSWQALILWVIILAAVTYIYFISPALKIFSESGDPRKVEELRKKMEDCC